MKERMKWKRIDLKADLSLLKRDKSELQMDDRNVDNRDINVY